MSLFQITAGTVEAVRRVVGLAMHNCLGNWQRCKCCASMTALPRRHFPSLACSQQSGHSCSDKITVSTAGGMAWEARSKDASS
jgi:hypothetical protein